MKIEITRISCTEAKSQRQTYNHFYDIHVEMRAPRLIIESDIEKILQNNLTQINWDLELLPPLPKTKQELTNCIVSFLENSPVESIIPRGDIMNFVDSHFKEK